MTERLVDVINDHHTILQTFAVTVESPQDPKRTATFEEEALKAAGRFGLVADGERAGLSARMHVSRGGALQPYSHLHLHASRQRRVLLHQRVRETAYSLWEAAGCPDDTARIHWLAAHEHLVRAHAYELWEREGRPEDQADAIWFRARELAMI